MAVVSPTSVYHLLCLQLDSDKVSSIYHYHITSKVEVLLSCSDHHSPQEAVMLCNENTTGQSSGLDGRDAHILLSNG
jgi:hypothetical protein